MHNIEEAKYTICHEILHFHKLLRVQDRRWFLLVPLRVVWVGQMQFLLPIPSKVKQLSVDWLIDWLIDWLTDWLIDWLIDWFLVGLHEWLGASLAHFYTVYYSFKFYLETASTMLFASQPKSDWSELIYFAPRTSWMQPTSLSEMLYFITTSHIEIGYKDVMP